MAEQTETTENTAGTTPEAPQADQSWADMIEVKDNPGVDVEDSGDNSKILNQEEIDSLLGYTADENE